MGPFEKRTRINVFWSQLGFIADAIILDWALGWPVTPWWIIPIAILTAYNAVRVAGYAWGGGKAAIETAVTDSYSREARAELQAAYEAESYESLDEAGQHAKDLYDEARARAMGSAD